MKAAVLFITMVTLLLLNHEQLITCVLLSYCRHRYTAEAYTSIDTLWQEGNCGSPQKLSQQRHGSEQADSRQLCRVLGQG